MMPRRSFAELPKTLFYMLKLAASYPSSLASFSSSMIISFFYFRWCCPHLFWKSGLCLKCLLTAWPIQINSSGNTYMYNALYVDTFTVVDCKLSVLPSIDVVKFPDLHFTIDYIPQKYLWIVWYDKAIPRVN